MLKIDFKLSQKNLFSTYLCIIQIFVTNLNLRSVKICQIHDFSYLYYSVWNQNEHFTYFRVHNIRINKTMDEQMKDEGMDGWINEWIIGWMNG